LEDHGFPTTNSKRNNDVKPAPKQPVAKFSEENLAKFCTMKEMGTADFELKSFFWCDEHKQQLEDYVQRKKTQMNNKTTLVLAAGGIPPNKVAPKRGLCKGCSKYKWTT
jgi:hypothetical protein